MLQNTLNVALEAHFSRFCVWSWLGKQRIKVRTIDENSNLVSSGRKILKSCDLCVTDERVLTGLTHILRARWKLIPCKNHHRWNPPPPLFFQSLTGESIYGMEIYAVFLSERRRICVSWSYFAQQRPFPSVPLESMEEEQPAAMPEDTHTHTHTPADDCRVEGLPLWPRGLDQRTHTYNFTHAAVIYLCVSVSVIWF